MDIELGSSTRCCEVGDRRALRLDVGKRLIMNVLQLLSLQIHTADSYG